MRVAVLLSVALLSAASSWAQAPPQVGVPRSEPVPSALTLDEALRLAQARSEQIAYAQAIATRARSDERLARSELFPQVFASTSYDRTLASEFSGLFSGSTGPSCDPFTIRPEAPLADRVAEIERAIDCGAVGNPFGGVSLNNLPFGRTNIYRFNLSASQNIYSGGRVKAQRHLAAIGRETADVGVDSARAQTLLEMTQAFYDAALSDRLVAIAEATLQQAEATLARVKLGREAGRQPEFDLLRAQVDRDNQVPAVIRARSQRTLAYLRLKQILEVPVEQEISVVADLDAEALPPPERFASRLTEAELARAVAAVDQRAPLRQAEAGVRARAAALDVARAGRMPTVSATSLFSRVGYPSNIWPGADYRTNWTVGISAQIPLFTGGRLRASEDGARADLLASEAQLKLVRELAVLDAQSAYETLRAARASWEASAGTVQQAERAYQIAELRYREGISTQLELSDARLLLQQAQANRAVAARDLQVARVRLALLPDLPLSLTGSGGPSSAAAQGGSSSGAAAGSSSGRTGGSGL